MRLAHSVYGGHLASKKTEIKLKISFTWPTIAIDVQRFCETCHECQKRRRVNVYNRVPIVPIPRHDSVFQVWVIDCFGPLFPNQTVKYNYALVLCDSRSRFPVAFALTSLTAKNVCKAFLHLFQFTGVPWNFTSVGLHVTLCDPMWHVSSRSGVATLRTAIHLLLTYLPSVIQSDMASDFNFQLTKTFLSMLGCTPRFNVPGSPQQSGLCEHLFGTLKNMASKILASAYFMACARMP